jgi:malate dehydrogenase (oxaloacetate-decarboxylating)
MCLAASRAIAGTIRDGTVSPDRILPSPLDVNLHANVAEAVAQAAIEEGLARIRLTLGEVAARTLHLRKLVETRQRELAHLSIRVAGTPNLTSADRSR